MSGRKKHKGLAIALAAVLVLGLAALVGIGGCGGGSESVSTTAAGMASRATMTTAGATTTITWATPAGDGSGESAGVPSYNDSPAGGGTDVAVVGTGTLTALQMASGQKIITDAQLWIEVESGKFQIAFDQAVLLAGRYGGYVMSANSQASGDDEGMRSGTISIRIPVGSFDNALGDASKFGTVKNQEVSTQDVTEEYVDLQARIKNSEAYVSSILALLGKAKTVDEILQVQSVLTYAQQDLEQLKGRMRYLEEHTSYSTLTMYLYETGVEVPSEGAWGTGKAFEAALHNLVDAVNAIIRGLGVLIPVLVVLAIIAYIAYVIVRAVIRRNRERAQARYQPYPQGWHGQPVQPGPGPGAPLAQPGAQTQSGTAPASEAPANSGQGAPEPKS
ncbi:MAG: hypothetical protein A2133_06415 [Actinobacteria bacterium RBG_16_64_13]|nr:MAG: hypothetical protein A2133_06415 [Actinobacteria bacterium RBG_16_64_13]